MPEQGVLSELPYKAPILYGSGTQTLVRGNDCSVFKMENETGEGSMTWYPVLPELNFYIMTFT